jgi:hypothetical protein
MVAENDSENNTKQSAITFNLGSGVSVCVFSFVGSSFPTSFVSDDIN